MKTSKLGIALAVALLTVSLFLLVGAGATPDPAEAARLNNIGVAYMNQQLFEKALKSFTEAAAKDPGMRVVTLNLGVALMNLQRADEAKALLETAAKDDPTDAHSFYNLGLYYKNTSVPESAVKAFQRVAEIDPNDADTWYFLGSTYAQLKQFPEAVAAFEHALKLDPLHASAQFGLARAYQQSGQTDPAHEAMKKFQYITQNKLGSPISLIYGEQGKYSRAEDSPVAVQKVLPQIPVRFVDVTRSAGLMNIPSSYMPHGPAYFGSGACFLDYDNDGHIDLFLPDGGVLGGMSLYRNLGNGKFDDVTVKAGLDPALHGTACAAGDYDNDGFVDLAVSVGDGVVLLHNEKNGTFRDTSPKSGLRPNRLPHGVMWVDYDHDGDLDLLLNSFLLSRDAAGQRVGDELWRNNGDGTFTNVSEQTGFSGQGPHYAALGTDFNNDRAVDIVLTGAATSSIFINPREGRFAPLALFQDEGLALPVNGLTVLDFDHDGWMDLAATHWLHASDGPALSLLRNDHGKKFVPVQLPETSLAHAFGIVALDYDNDGWVDLAAVGETKDGRGEVRLFRNLGPDGWKDVTADVGLDNIQLKEPRAIIAGDYDDDGAVDLLITQNHGPAVLLRNEGGNKNNSLRLALKGLNDNKSAIGTKVEVFSAGIRQKFEVYGSSGYLGQNSPYLTIGLGQAKEADVVRMLWPSGVLQDEIEVAANKRQEFLEIDRRGSSCPTLFAWDGTRYALVGDMLGAGVIGHWVGAADGKVERNIPRPTEAIKLDRHTLREKDGKLSFRFMEPLEESVYLDQAKLLAVDHPAAFDVYPNEYFASNPPYPPFKVVFSNNKDAHPPAGAWDGHGHNVLPDLLAHRYVGDFKVLPFLGFAEPHTLELDLGAPYQGGPLWLLMHGEIEYFTATSMYAADQARIAPFAPYLEAQNEKGKWVRAIDDLGFPAGGPRTMTADLTDKLPKGTRRIRLTTNLQIYWDNILVSYTDQEQSSRVTPVPLARANLSFHGFPLKIENQPPGNVEYIYEQTSATGPYTRPAGAYTRYGDVVPLLTGLDDKFAVFGSGDEIALDFNPSSLPTLPAGWVRDYFFVAHGYEKDMDFYAYRGDTVTPLPFGAMKSYPYRDQSFPADPDHMNYQLEYNTRFMSGNEARGYAFHYERH
jgi:tetratricopeptide (TPR) repeat protein